MPDTPQEWLPVLCKRLDAARPRIANLKKYLDGDAPLPEMGPNLRASWERFQKKSRTNWAELIVESVADRIVPIGIEIAGSSDSDEAKLAQRIWRDNRMDVLVKQLVRDGIALRDAYLCVWAGDGGKAVITTESADKMYAATDPLQPWVVRAAIRVWRDEDTERDYAMVWASNGQAQKFSRQMSNIHQKLLTRASAGTWQPETEPEQIAGGVPVFIWQNPSGFGEYERHTDLIDRINLGVLQRLVTTAMQAFRQRALKRKEQEQNFTASEDDADKDDEDYSKVFEPAPGALWDLPDGWDLWESQYTDITPMLTGEKGDLRDLAAVSRTPLPMLVPDGANQTATGAAEMTSGLYFKARDRVQVTQNVLAAALLKALRIEGIEPSGTITVLCENPERVTLSEKYAAAAAAKTAGESWKSIQRNVLGRSPDQIKQDAADRASEQLAAAMLTAATTQPQTPAPAAGGSNGNDTAASRA